MRICEATLQSLTPYSQSRFHDTPKQGRGENSGDSEGADVITQTETPDAYEARTWRERVHTDEQGVIFIPPMAFKNAMSDIAKFLSMPIPSKGKSTYTKHFEAGVMVIDSLSLGVKKDEVEGEWFFVPSDGRRGSGKRVKRCFPVIRQWSGTIKFYIMDDTITEKVFEHHLREAGKFIGIGRFRPRNNGFYGRFTVVQVKWVKE